MKAKFNYKQLAADLVSHRQDKDLSLSQMVETTGVEKTKLFRVELGAVSDVEVLASVCAVIRKPLSKYLTVLILCAVLFTSCSKSQMSDLSAPASNRARGQALAVRADSASNKGVSVYWWQYATLYEYAGYLVRVKNENAYPVTVTLTAPQIGATTTQEIPAGADNAVQIGYEYVSAGNAYISGLQIDLSVQAPNVRLSIFTP